MKKNFKYYIIAWAVLLVIFNVIAFALPKIPAVEEKYTPTFFIGYIFITLCLIGQLAVAYFSLNKADIKETFYNVGLVKISYAGLILSFIFGGIFMVLSFVPEWVGIIVCVIILGGNAIAVVKAKAAAEIVSNVDKKVKSQTSYIKLTTVDAQNLVDSAKSEDIKAECKKVYEALRYSDPMSSSDLSVEEAKITVKMSEFSQAVQGGDVEKIKAVADELVSVIKARNNKCKALK